MSKPRTKHIEPSSNGARDRIAKAQKPSSIGHERHQPDAQRRFANSPRKPGHDSYFTNKAVVFLATIDFSSGSYERLMKRFST
jgi:hypothetical protein